MNARNAKVATVTIVNEIWSPVISSHPISSAAGTD